MHNEYNTPCPFMTVDFCCSENVLNFFSTLLNVLTRAPAGGRITTFKGQFPSLLGPGQRI